MVASPDGREGSVEIHQDAYVYAALLDGAERASRKLAPGRRAYVQVARGKVTVNGNPLDAGDALKAVDAPEIVLEKGEKAAEKDQARYPRLRAESYTIWPYYIKGVWEGSNGGSAG